MNDIVSRLRESVKACRALDRSALLEEAAGEIEKLRQRLRLADAAIRSESPALTAAERAAVADAADRYAEVTSESAETAATLRGLLERLK